MPTSMPAAAGVLLAFVVAACGGGTQKESESQAPAPARVTLAGFAAQRIAVTPTSQARADSLGWVQQLGGATAAAARVDTALLAVLTERGFAQRWVMPAQLIRSFERNRTYAADPRVLAVEQLRSPKFAPADRYGEPLSSQLRTMVALHADVRFVLLPVELRFERQGATGYAVLRAALLDARAAEARWVGDVRGDAAAAPSGAIASVAAKLADLFAAR